MLTSVLSAELQESLVKAIAGLGLVVHDGPTTDRRDGPDFVLDVEGQRVMVEVKASVSPSDVGLVMSQMADWGPGVRLLAARRVSDGARAAIARVGGSYFDARGHLRLWSPPLLIDADVDAPRPASTPAARHRLDTPALLDVALAVLDGTAITGVRATAHAIGRSPGTVSKCLATLRSNYLTDVGSTPTVPNLFHAVLEEWRPVRLPLGGQPSPGMGRSSTERIRLGEERADVGWVYADRFAAAAWGAPVVLESNAPPDFYVPDGLALQRARTLFGDAEFGAHACTVAVPPAPYVCRRRFPPTRDARWLEFAPSKIVAYLDLASDPARGRETLEDWERMRPDEVDRVW